MIPTPVLLSCCEGACGYHLDGPLGKAAVKAKSITDSEEESADTYKSFSSKDKSVGRGGGGGRERDRRVICYSNQRMNHDLILFLLLPSPPFPTPVWCNSSPSTQWWGRRPECTPSLSGETCSSGICSW